MFFSYQGATSCSGIIRYDNHITWGVFFILLSANNDNSL